MPGGRPSKFEDLDLSKVKLVAEKGWTDMEMAELFEVHIATWYRWKANYPEFCDALSNWKENADARVERSLYERAMGYSMTDTKFATYEGQITDEREYTKHVPPDTTACIFWLKNRQPKVWRDRVEYNHGGQVDNPIQVLGGEINPEDAAAIYKDAMAGEPTAE